MRSSPNGKGRTSGALVQSVDRAVTVLEMLARHGESGITEIAAELGVHKSTASRLVSVLESRGLVEQLGDRGKYAIGFGVVRLAGAATNRMDLSQLGRPYCDVLANELGETVNIAIRDEDVAVNLNQVRGTAAVTAHNWTGRRTPLHATSSGKVLLAHLDPEERESLLSLPLERFTQRTIVEPDELHKDLDSVLRQGYATSFEELEVGLNAVAVPVFGNDAAVLAAMSASGPSYRLSRRRAHEIAKIMSPAVEELSAQLGYLGP